LQLRAPDSLVEIYTDELEMIGGRMEALRDRIAVLERQAVSAEARGQVLELADLTQIGELFWGLSHREINQHLHRLFAAFRLVVRDGLIIGIRPS
jgi:hypothetical protein